MLALRTSFSHPQSSPIHALSFPSHHHLGTGIYRSPSPAPHNPTLRHCYFPHGHCRRSFRANTPSRALYLRQRLHCYHRLHYLVYSTDKSPWRLICGHHLRCLRDLPCHSDCVVLGSEQRLRTDEACNGQCAADLHRESWRCAWDAAVSAKYKSAVLPGTWICDWVSDREYLRRGHALACFDSGESKEGKGTRRPQYKRDGADFE